jgi:hypothetical protein
MFGVSATTIAVVPTAATTMVARRRTRARTVDVQATEGTFAAGVSR